MIREHRSLLHSSRWKNQARDAGPLMNSSPYPRIEGFLSKVLDPEPDAKEHLAKCFELRGQSLLDLIPDAVLIVNRAGEIVVANLQAEKLYGYRREEFIGRSAESLIPPRLRVEHTEHRESFFGDLCSRPMGTGLQLFAWRKDATEIPVEIRLNLLTIEAGTFLVLAVRDTTDRHRTEGLKMLEAVLRETSASEERFSLIADRAPALIWMSDTDKLCTYVNKSWLDFTGRSADCELGNGWSGAVHAEDLWRREETYGQAFDCRKEFRTEYRLRRHDGEYRWILDIGVPRFDQEHSFVGYIGIGVDVTECKVAEMTMARVNRNLLEAQEQERTRIARELHDDFSQRLALISMKVTNLAGRDRQVSAEELKADLEEVRESISSVAEDLHGLSRQLHPARLELLGLVRALRAQCSEFERTRRIETVFEASVSNEDASPQAAICLYRLLQESLMNIANHSGSKKAYVTLDRVEDQLEMRVRDEGQGFIPGETEVKGIGLTNMEERVCLLNGKLIINSRPGKGTEIVIRIPALSQAKHEASPVPGT